MMLGAIGLATSTIGALAMWHLGDHGFAITLVMVALPCACAGGALHLAARA